jgi:hypothetical protein
MNNSSKLAGELVSALSERMRTESDYQIPKAYIGTVFSIDDVNAPIIAINKQRLGRQSYKVAKSVPVGNLRVGDEVLMAETYVGTPVLLALLRTDDDVSNAIEKPEQNVYVEIFGDGVNSTYTFEHNLNTTYITVCIWDHATNELHLDKHDSIIATDENNVEIVMKAISAVDEHRIVIHK